MELGWVGRVRKLRDFLFHVFNIFVVGFAVVFGVGVAVFGGGGLLGREGRGSGGEVEGELGEEGVEDGVGGGGERGIKFIEDIHF